MRFTIEEYAQHFKMSKELVTSKLRSKKLNYIIENETIYIITPVNEIYQTERISEQKSMVIPEKKVTVGMVISLYKQENEQLKQKIEQLEQKIDTLISDKETMLREERDRIEQLYNSKDEQLKSILELMNKKFMLEQNAATVHEITLEKTSNPVSYGRNSFVELKSYLKTLNLENYQRKILKKRFFDRLGDDIRIIFLQDKIYLDLDKFDYSDLLKI
jgi:small-conductance mechanosensitive channel